MVDMGRPARALRIGALTLMSVGLLSGCAMVPRARLDESQQLAESLRAENARLKDRVVGLEAQNRDYSDRALDDLRRLTARDEAIGRLERGMHAYQDDRDQLAGAYRRLAMSLGRTTEDGRVGPTAIQPGATSAPESRVRGDLGEESRSEGRSGRPDGGAVGPSPRPSADDAGP
jgi:hypothetical protein